MKQLMCLNAWCANATVKMPWMRASALQMAGRWASCAHSSSMIWASSAQDGFFSLTRCVSFAQAAFSFVM